MSSCRLFVLSGLILVISALSNILSAESREIKIVVGQKNVFEVAGSKEPVIYVKAGEVIKLTVTVRPRKISVSHTFTVKEFKDQGWDIKLKEGTKAYTLVVPDAPGEYLFECAIKCGEGHETMNGKLIIE